MSSKKASGIIKMSGYAICLLHILVWQFYFFLLIFVLVQTITIRTTYTTRHQATTTPR